MSSDSGSNSSFCDVIIPICLSATSVVSFVLGVFIASSFYLCYVCVSRRHRKKKMPVEVSNKNAAPKADGDVVFRNLGLAPVRPHPSPVSSAITTSRNVQTSSHYHMEPVSVTCSCSAPVPYATAAASSHVNAQPSSLPAVPLSTSRAAHSVEYHNVVTQKKAKGYVNVVPMQRNASYAVATKPQSSLC